MTEKDKSPQNTGKRIDLNESLNRISNLNPNVPTEKSLDGITNLNPQAIQPNSEHQNQTQNDSTSGQGDSSQPSTDN